MRKTYIRILLVVVLAASVSATRSPEILNCTLFNPNNIKLVTFDVFAALSLLVDSLTQNIASILPQLSSSQVDQVVNEWLLAYEDHEGLNYSVSITGPQPFRWMLTTTLPQILADVGIDSVSPATFNALVDSWGDLTPRKTAKYTLIKLNAAGFQVGPLSNGDVITISTAFSVYAPEVKPSFTFTSDFPVMCFKNCSGIYQHVLDVTGYNPLQVLHVAGAMYDGQGARNAGLFSAVLEGNTMRSRRSVDSADAPQPCFLLQSLSDLVPILVP